MAYHFIWLPCWTKLLLYTSTDSLLAPVANPCDKNFSPKEVPTCVKVPVPLPKQYEPVDTFPLMLSAPKATAVPQVPDTENTKFLVWLETFWARAAHANFLAATMLEAMYMMNLNTLAQLTEALPKSGDAAWRNHPVKGPLPSNRSILP